MSRRQDAATATVGAGLTATGGYLRHAGVQEYIEHHKKEPRWHGPAIARRGNPLSRKLYGAGALVGVLGAPALAIGGTKFVRGDRTKPTPLAKRDPNKPSFLEEGLKGTGEALVERKDTAMQPNVPFKARAAGAGTSVGAGALGALAARGLLRHKGGGTKALVTPVAGVLAGAAATPLSSKVVHHVAPGYEVTPSGVKRKKRALRRASSASYQHRDLPRSFQSDIAKDASSRGYRAKVTAAGAIPMANYAIQPFVAGQGIKDADHRHRAQASQAGATLGGDAVGGLAGAHGAAYAAAHSDKFRQQADSVNAGIESMRAKVGLKPKIIKPAAAANSRTGKIIRGATKPLHGKYAVAAGVGALGGMMTIGNAAQQVAISHNLKHNVGKYAGPGMTRKEQQKQLKRKSRLIAINTMGATTGAAGLAAYGASKHPGLIAHKPQLEGLTLGLGALGGGIGSYAGFKRAKVEHRDLKAQRKALGVAKGMPDQSELSTPAGLLKAKTYTSSSYRRKPSTGQLVRVKAGLR